MTKYCLPHELINEKVGATWICCYGDICYGLCDECYQKQIEKEQCRSINYIEKIK